MKKTAIIIAIVFLFIWGIWIIAIPSKLISGFIEDSLKKQSIRIDLDGLEKGLFYSISKKSVKISNSDNSLILTINNLTAEINFASFMKLSPGIDFNSNIGKGTINGNVSYDKDAGWVMQIKGSGIDISDLPVAEVTSGINGTGDIDFDLYKKGKRSEIKFSLSDINIKSSGLLPLDIFNKARGVMTEENGLIDVKSLVMEGKGLYARVKGYIRGNNHNLNIELMVNSSSDMNPSYLTILEKYKVSPGYYVIKPNAILSEFQISP